MHNYRMYIIAIGWLYVTILVAANEASLVAGIISFIFYGLLPCSILLWMSGSKVRRQRRAYREAQLARSVQPDQTALAPGDAVAPVGEEALAIGDSAQTAPVNTNDPGSRQPPPG
jgi:hypothetical protein